MAKSKRGFASAAKRPTAAAAGRKGGKSTQAKGKAPKFNGTSAKAHGRTGGKASAAKRKQRNQVIEDSLNAPAPDDVKGADEDEEEEQTLTSFREPD